MASEKLIRVGEAKAKLMAVHAWFDGPVQTEQDKLAQAVVKMCIEEIDKLEPVQKWIPVTERLPSDRGDVLVVAWWHEKWQTMVGWYGDMSVRWHIITIKGDFPCDHVTHWMPLPEPPKGE